MITLPFLLSDPAIEQDQKNEDFGTYKIIGELGTRKTQLQGLLPARKMPSMPKGSFSNPKYYIDWINRLRGELIPLRLILIQKDDTEFLNMPMLINNFSYTPQRNGNILVSIDIEEFRFKRVKVI